MTGAERITQERERQISGEGWTAEHDDDHFSGELALMAALYATPKLLFERVDRANCIEFVDPWPFEDLWDKRPANGNVVLPNRSLSVNKRIDQLVKAGALIAAEIDRLERVRAAGEVQGQMKAEDER